MHHGTEDPFLLRGSRMRGQCALLLPSNLRASSSSTCRPRQVGVLWGIEDPLLEGGLDEEANRKAAAARGLQRVPNFGA